MKNISLAARALVAAALGPALAATELPSATSAAPRRIRVPIKPDAAKRLEIMAWNDEVERRKRAKKARKLARLLKKEQQA